MHYELDSEQVAKCDLNRDAQANFAPFRCPTANI